MHLLLDVGNSNLKWGLHDGAAIIETGHIAINPLVESSLESINPGNKSVKHIAAAIVSGDALTSKLNAWTVDRFDMALELAVTQREALGVRCAYENPEQLGVDRWAAVVAAWHQDRKPVIVVDCGTAITVDAVDANGQHLGGWIAPGRSLMEKSLVQGASRIPAGKGQYKSGPANITRDAVFSGTTLATAAFIDRAVSALRSDTNDYQCIVTGGDAKSLLTHLTSQYKHQPHLVLEGVMLLAGEMQ